MILTLAWWSRTSDTASIKRVLQRADSVLREPPRSPRLQLDAQYGASAARARLSLARGDTTGALSYFAQLPDSLVPFLRYFDRFDRARALAAQRQYREAAAVLDSKLPPEYTLTVSEVIWWLERARVAAQLQNHDLARRGYVIVSRAWANADPELRRYVDEAERALRPRVVALK
jgi:hypothetical protein